MRLLDALAGLSSLEGGLASSLRCAYTPKSVEEQVLPKRPKTPAAVAANCPEPRCRCLFRVGP